MNQTENSVSPQERTQKQIENSFRWHTADEADQKTMATNRQMFMELATRLNEVCPQSRELSLALTKLEEAMMWANSSIVKNHEKDLESK